MKRKWEEPRIEVQKFEANEYVAACWLVSGGSNYVVLDICPTDGKLTEPNVPNSWNHLGFNDDGFDFLTGGDDTIPNGWNSGWVGTEAELSHVKAGLDFVYGPANGTYGNKGATKNEIEALYTGNVYWFGNRAEPIRITESNCSGYGVGPNAS